MFFLFWGIAKSYNKLNKPSYNKILEDNKKITSKFIFNEPTDAQLTSHEASANTAESNSQVDATRRQAYGFWGDQLDEIYHDIDAWKARIQNIKTDNP